MKLILSAAYGDHGHALAGISAPFMEAYAARIGAEFILARSDQTWSNTAKLGLIRGCLDDGCDRLLWIDADALIRPDCPDLFNIVPADHWAAYDECSRWDDTMIHALHQDMVRVCGLEGLPIPESNARYYNAGLQLTHRGLRDLYQPPGAAEDAWAYEQTLTNVRLFLRPDVKRFDLPDAFNALVYYTAPKRPEASCFILHFAGPPGHQARIERMQAVAQLWRDRWPIAD